MRLHRARRRVVAVTLLIATTFALLLGRLTVLQIGAHREARSLHARQSRRTEVVPAERGALCDRFERPLSASVAAAQFWSWPPAVREVVAPPDREAFLDETAAWLAERVDAPIDELRARLAGPPPDAEERGPLWRKLGAPVTDPRLVNEILERGLAGVVLGEEPGAVRCAVADGVGARVLGVVDHEGVGVAGLERGLDTWLAGVHGERAFTVDHRGREIVDLARDGLEHAPIDGADVVLTLDAELQRAVEQEIAGVLDEQRAQWVSAVLLDPRNGEVLAMASRSREDETEPLPPLCSVQRQYAPGSTMKPLFMAAALDLDLCREDERIDVGDGDWRFGGRVVRDSHPRGVPLTPAEILVDSSNIGMARIAMRLVPPGTSRTDARVAMRPIHDRLRALGFGARTGVPIPAELPGVVTPLSEWIPEYSLVSVSYGQELAVTPLQMAAAVATLADGIHRAPRLVRAIVLPDGRRVESEPPADRRVFSRENADLVRHWMTWVTRGNRYADDVAVDGVALACKTGTGTREDDRAEVSSSFIALAPAEAPRLALVVVVDRPQAARFASVVAAPTAGRILRRALPYLGVAE